ncbi:MAG: chorismate synthase [Paludibacteraceae bacterium]|nr:chorismate synthase [Paludibacteraceae bacterium]
MSNKFGDIFSFTSFGESHGVAVGGVIDGMPAGVKIDEAFIQSELDRRRPGQSHLTTSRKESDKVEILSGVFEGKTTGTPIGFIVRNEDHHSADYSNIKEVFRPSHADYTYQMKYGIRDYRGGGRSSARENISRVVAGAFAKTYLNMLGVKITAYTSQVGDIEVSRDYKSLDFNEIEKNPVRCADANVAKQMEQLITEVKSDGDTIGGVVTCVIQNVPVGLGEPIYDKLHAALGSAMLSINAVKGFEYGLGFEAAKHRGTEINDIFYQENGVVKTKTNNSGGIQGGISNGQDIVFRVAFKPVPTILKTQETIDTNLKSATIMPKGRHDACVLPRAVPVVEAMSAVVMLDMYLKNKAR